MGSAKAVEPKGIAGTSVLLVTADIGARERLTQALRAAGVHVAERRHGPPPAVDVVLVDARTEAQTRKDLDLIRGDVRMRWASVVRADFRQAVPPGAATNLNAIAAVLEPAVGEDRSLTSRAMHEDEFSIRLAPLGPIRILRAVAASGRTMHLTFGGQQARGEVDVADGLVVCAFSDSKQRHLEGGIALAPLLDLDDALIKISRRDHPTAVNVMEPVDQALEVAAVERQSLMQPLPDNDTGALLEAAAEADVSVLDKDSGVRDGTVSERPTMAEESDSDIEELTPEDELPSIHPVDDLPTAPPQVGQQPPVPRVATGDPSKKFAKTMIGSGMQSPGFGTATTGRNFTPARPAKPASTTTRQQPAAPARPQGPTDQRAQQPASPRAKTLWGVAPPPRPAAKPPSARNLPPVPVDQTPTSASGGKLPPVPDQAAPGSRRNLPPVAQQDAFAKTQMAMQPPPAPPEVDEDDEPTQIGQSLREQAMEATRAAAAASKSASGNRQGIHAESDGLLPSSVGATPTSDGRRPETETEELSVAEALSSSMDDIDDELASHANAPPADNAPPAPATEDAAPQQDAQAPAQEARPARTSVSAFDETPILDASMLGEDGRLLLPSHKQPKSNKAFKLALGAAALGLGALAAVWWQGRGGPGPSEETLEAAAPAAEAQPAAAAAPEPEGTPTATAEPVAGAEAEQAVADAPPEPAEAEAQQEAAPAVEEAPAEPTEEEPAVEDDEAEDEAEARGESDDDDDDETPRAGGARDKKGSDKVCRKARRLERDGAMDEAMHLYEEGLALDPRNPRAYAGIARIQLDRGNASEAIEAAQTAVQLRSRRARYRVLLGDAFKAAGRDSDAKQAWQKALELDPEDRHAKRRLD